MSRDLVCTVVVLALTIELMAIAQFGSGTFEATFFIYISRRPQLSGNDHPWFSGGEARTRQTESDVIFMTTLIHRM